MMVNATHSDTTLTAASKVGERVEVNGKSGVVTLAEVSFYFGGTYFRILFDDATTGRILVS